MVSSLLAAMVIISPTTPSVGFTTLTPAEVAPPASAADPDLAGMPDADAAAPEVLPLANDASSPAARWNLRWQTLGATRMGHGPALDNYEMNSHFDLGVGAQVGPALAVQASGRLRYDVRGSEMRYGFESELRELFITLRDDAFTLRIGQRTLRWGSTDIFSPNDIVNPVDYREGFRPELDVPLVPIPLAQVQMAWEHAAVEFTYAPFFSPHRLSVYGGPWSLLDPQPQFHTLVGALKHEVSSAAEEDVQSLLVAGDPPDESILNGSLGTRVTLRGPRFDVNASASYAWDRNPVVTVDASKRGLSMISTRYERQVVLGLDGRMVLGNLVAKFDVTYQPERTTYTQSMMSARPRVMCAAGGFEYLRGSSSQVLVEMVGLRTLDSAPAGDSYVFFHDTSLQLAAYARHSFVDDQWRLEIMGRYSLSEHDWYLAPSLSYQVRSGHMMSLGALAIGGPAGTVGGLFDANDQVLVRYVLSI